jgi:hypothetical protein
MPLPQAGDFTLPSPHFRSNFSFYNISYQRRPTNLKADGLKVRGRKEVKEILFGSQEAPNQATKKRCIYRLLNTVP